MIVYMPYALATIILLSYPPELLTSINCK